MSDFANYYLTHKQCDNVDAPLECDLLIADPPFELWPEFYEKVNKWGNQCEHVLAFSKQPHTARMQVALMDQGLQFICEYIWYYTDTQTFRAKYMPLLHHETISVFSRNKKGINMENIRESIRRPTEKRQYKTNLTRGKTGERIYWEPNPNGSWRSSVIPIQRTQSGILLKNPTPIGAKPTLLFDALIPAFGQKAVFDPFCGAGAAGVASLKCNRNYYGIDANADYLETAKQRISIEIEAHRNHID